MGDRAIIQCRDASGYRSPALYLHWHGSEAPALVADAAPHMRAGDVDYAFARLVGRLHTLIDGPLGMGVFNVGESDAEIDTHLPTYVVDVTARTLSYEGEVIERDLPLARE